VTPRTSLLTTRSGVTLEYLVTGVGTPEPVTVFAHGLGGDIDTTRPLGSGVPGRKVFFHFRGHGRSSVPPGLWTFDDLAGDLAAVADHVGATRALGVSLGAAALCRLLLDRPDRFARVVFYLPAVLDRPRSRLPRPDLAAGYAGLPGQVAVPDPAQLGKVTVPALVLACRDDELHRVDIAERLAAALPAATLYVFDRPEPVLTARAELRRQISAFLGS
jgi:3-oxoadipate enol-lactonase